MKEVFIELPVCNQRELSAEWEYRGCAICSLWMLLKWHDKNFSLMPAELLQEGLASDAYLQNVGWKHGPMMELAGRHGLAMDYAKNFFYSDEEKETGLKLISERLHAGKPVLASIFKELNHAKDGHMIVLRGIKEFSGVIIGFDVQDPDPNWRGHQYFLSRQEFLDGWRGGLIWPK